MKYTFSVTVTVRKKVNRQDVKAALDEALQDEVSQLVMQEYLDNETGSMYLNVKVID